MQRRPVPHRKALRELCAQLCRRTVRTVLPFGIAACRQASIAPAQALLHLLLECGELGATVGILWHSLRAYRPLSLGWFRARIRPLRAWLCPALLACAFFPLVDLAAARSQVRLPTSLTHTGMQPLRTGAPARQDSAPAKLSES